MDVTNPYKSIWFGCVHGPEPYETIGFRATNISHTPLWSRPGRLLMKSLVDLGVYTTAVGLKTNPNTSGAPRTHENHWQPSNTLRSWSQNQIFGTHTASSRGPHRNWAFPEGRGRLDPQNWVFIRICQRLGWLPEALPAPPRRTVCCSFSFKRLSQSASRECGL